ncbi:MAG: hypothetical protein HYU36_18360 [Planctomycetes bacterium]|nr:hypothetical protein [Planctomycetota bacterium]
MSATTDSAALLACLLGFMLAFIRMGRGHESPVDHVGRTVRLWYEGGKLHLAYRIEVTERAAMMQLHRMDRDGDAVIEEGERADYFRAVGQELAERFVLELDGKPLGIRPAGEVKLDAALGQTYIFEADMDDLATGRHAGVLTDGFSRSYPGPYRVESSAGPGGRDARLQITQGPGVMGLQRHPGEVQLRFELVVP